ncbi:hypothetical protein B0H14DRAFT_2621774 [Mycena olivaceomarginata]|nr:hypothetical protein B0H14DRAFT_2621774 [Mycena olivaceomarginata]
MPPQAFTQTSGFSAPPPFQPDFSFHNTFQATFNGSVPAAASASTMRAPLGDATNMANLDARGKRKRSGNQNGSRKRRHINATDADTPAVFGVGPSSATAGAAAAASQSVFHPSLINIPNVNFGSVLDNNTVSSASATDVWFFVRGVNSNAVPTSPPEPSEMLIKRPDKMEFSHLACRFCSLERWSTWKNVDGQTPAIRNHLKAEHGKIWRVLVLLKQIKGGETIGASTETAPGERKEFSIPGFYNRLVKWIAVDDQARLFVYFLIPLMLLSAWNSGTCCSSLRPVGRRGHPSLYQNVAIDRYLKIQMGIWCSKHDWWPFIVWREVTVVKISARFLSRPGKRLVHKMVMITCDNASSNDTGRTEIEYELTLTGIPFDNEGNCIRFPDLPAYQPDIFLNKNGNIIPQSLRDNVQYWTALWNDPVTQARSLVTACRALGQLSPRWSFLEHTTFSSSTAPKFRSRGHFGVVHIC